MDEAKREENDRKRAMAGVDYGEIIGRLRREIEGLHREISDLREENARLKKREIKEEPNVTKAMGMSGELRNLITGIDKEGRARIYENMETYEEFQNLGSCISNFLWLAFEENAGWEKRKELK